MSGYKGQWQHAAPWPGLLCSCECQSPQWQVPLNVCWLSVHMRTHISRCISASAWMVMLGRTGSPGKAISFSKNRQCQLRACCFHSEPEFILLRRISQRSLENFQYLRVKKNCFSIKHNKRPHVLRLLCLLACRTLLLNDLVLQAAIRIISLTNAVPGGVSALSISLHG